MEPKDTLPDTSPTLVNRLTSEWGGYRNDQKKVIIIFFSVLALIFLSGLVLFDLPRQKFCKSIGGTYYVMKRPRSDPDGCYVSLETWRESEPYIWQWQEKTGRKLEVNIREFNCQVLPWTDNSVKCLGG